MKGPQGQPLLTGAGGGESSCLQLSSSQAVCSPALGRSQCGLGCYVYPQDPAKARWLVGSSTLLSGLLFFLLLPPLLFCHMEGWSYVESFYFAFITLSTVGFGDYVIGERTLQVVGGQAWTLSCPAFPCLLHLLAPATCQALWGLGGPKSRGHSPWQVQPALLCEGAKVQLKSNNWSLTPVLGAGC